MEMITPPAIYDSDIYPNKIPVFMAGGITGCPDWQKEMGELLVDTDYVLLNPRRDNFPMDNPSASYNQILWEHDHFRVALLNMYWFPKETLCPIVLYELGAWSMTNRPLFIGVDPEYKRRQDVEIQTKLTRPDVIITYSLADLAESIKTYSKLI